MSSSRRFHCVVNRSTLTLIWASITLIFLLFSSCSISASRSTMIAETRNFKPRWQPAPKEGMVYVIRPSTFGAVGRDLFHVFIQNIRTGEQVAVTSTWNMEYICLALPPGDYLLESKAENRATLPLKIAPGKTYYVHQKPRMGMGRAANRLLLIDEVEGKYYIKRIDQADVDGKTKAAWIDQMKGEPYRPISNKRPCYRPFDPRK